MITFLSQAAKAACRPQNGSLQPNHPPSVSTVLMEYPRLISICSSARGMTDRHIEMADKSCHAQNRPHHKSPDGSSVAGIRPTLRSTIFSADSSDVSISKPFSPQNFLSHPCCFTQIQRLFVIIFLSLSSVSVSLSENPFLNPFLLLSVFILSSMFLKSFKFFHCMELVKFNLVSACLQSHSPVPYPSFSLWLPRY